MAEKTQRLEIVTPERKVYSGDVRFVVVPGVEGELGFLPDHAPLVSALKIGVMKVQEDNRTFKVAISGGFVEVRNSRVTVLARTAERDDEIDRERAEAAKARAEQRLAARTPDIDVVRAELALKRALARLKAVS
ncbi:F0F1 ATP synthase subunit epsilon [Desulfofundulus salinus]|uniref:ATP synthase epsilon chain n=1 Tax=Desulfofundulus salinus TaxID=2419843 RepID=A0A494WXN6_9FIRM|nr:F0F1 ATP synthase subunit epsilon [Desulfofundulus salinum]RKO65637.1 F0F1 ATP synthase subunit epsilon [Desulfofundulus salinum]